MPLDGNRKRQIENALRNLQGRNDPALSEDIRQLQAKLDQNTENPDLPEIVTLEAPVQSQTDLTPITPTEQEIKQGADPNANPVTGISSGTGVSLPPQEFDQGSTINKLQEQITSLEQELEPLRNINKLKTGSEINIGLQLEELKRSNQSFRSLLGDELGIANFDNNLAQIEAQQGLLVNRDDEEVRRLFAEAAEARRTGILNEEDFQKNLENIVSQKGLNVEAATAITSPTLLDAEKRQQEGGPDTINGNVALVDKGFETPEIEEVGENVIKNNKTGVITYSDPDTGINFETNPTNNTLDLSKLSESDLETLDGAKLLQAELKTGLNTINNDNQITDSLIKSMLGIIQQSSDISRSFVEEATKVAEEKLIIENIQNQDAIEFRERELEIEQAETFDDLAEAQAKTEGYLKGKLSAFGAGSSTAALAIMSSNHLKFAKLRSRAAAKFSLEANKLQRMSTLAQRAFTNSIVELKLNTNKKVSDIALNTQEKVINLLGQKLKSDNQKVAERQKLHIDYIKGVNDLKATEAKAARDAEKDAQKWLKDNVQMAKWMSDQTGTIWLTGDDGQIYDTGELTEKNQLARDKFNASLTKKIGAGGTAISGEAADWIDSRRNLGLTDDQINNEIQFRWPGTSQGHTEIRNTARDYLQNTTQETSDVSVGEFLFGKNTAGSFDKFFTTAFGTNLPEIKVPTKNKKVFSTPIPEGIYGDYAAAEAAGALPPGVRGLDDFKRYQEEQELRKKLF